MYADVGGKLWHPTEDASSPGYARLRYNPCRQNGREGPTQLRETKVFLSRGVGISHWGKKPELLGFEVHDVGLGASIFGDGWINRALVQCRTGTVLQLPCTSCHAAGTLRSFPANGFTWYDTNQAVSTNVCMSRVHVVEMI